MGTASEKPSGNEPSGTQHGKDSEDYKRNSEGSQLAGTMLSDS